MSQGDKALSAILDDLALKILMVEPGDLSVVGELLELVEQLISSDEEDLSPGLRNMGKLFKTALEKMIMAELPDSAENYEQLGNCVAQMQEVVRKGGEADDAALASFCEALRRVGLEATVEELGGEAPAAPPAEEAQQQEAPAVSEQPEQEPSGEADAPAPPQEATADSGGTPDFLQDKDLLAGFIDEAFEHLESIEVNVLELEQNPDDLEIINNIFRPFHTIKGVSGFLNLKTINKLAHATENLLDDVRNGKRPMDSDVIDIVLNVGDSLKGMVENIKEVLDSGPDKYQEVDISDFLSQIDVLRKGGSPEKKTEPQVAETAASEPEGAGAAAAETGQEQQKPQPAPTPPAQEPQAPKAGARAAAPAPAAAKKRMGAIKVDVEKLDALVNAVGELVIMQSLVRQNPLITRIADPKLLKDFSQLGRITSELQRTAMAMRMVPIKQTFDKMIRLVRDLSKKTGKKVDLVMEGAETEIDRNMVDSIYDPLVHMMRNSVDHGIQTPEERAKHGKPPTGTVHLRAYQKGGNMVIEIEDDGEGLNTERIRQKAISRGLIQPGDNLSDHELNNLIFMPGFSTAEKITDVSGRGVGMDVVKKAVEKLRGKVEVVSTPGKGCLFTIRLPLTLAIIDGIIVRVGQERYIIPTIAIQESMKPEKKNYSTVQNRGEQLLVRGNLIPIIRLYEVFGVEPQYTDPCDAIVVVVENEGRRRALMVDELLGKEEVVIKSLGGMQDVKGVAGGTILGDGRVGLILDLAGIIADAEEA